MNSITSTNKFMLNKVKAYAREEQAKLNKGASCSGLNIWAADRITELEAELQALREAPHDMSVDVPCLRCACHEKRIEELDAKLQQLAREYLTLDTENKALIDESKALRERLAAYEKPIRDPYGNILNKLDPPINGAE